MSDAIILNSEAFAETIKEGVTLVDFWAPWCGPCRMLSPVIEELASEYKGKAKICKVNTEDEQALAAEHGIRSIPCIFFFKDGQKVAEIIGARTKEDFAAELDKHL